MASGEGEAEGDADSVAGDDAEGRGEGVEADGLLHAARHRADIQQRSISSFFIFFTY